MSKESRRPQTITWRATIEGFANEHAENHFSQSGFTLILIVTWDEAIHVFRHQNTGSLGFNAKITDPSKNELIEYHKFVFSDGDSHPITAEPVPGFVPCKGEDLTYEMSWKKITSPNLYNILRIGILRSKSAERT